MIFIFPCIFLDFMNNSIENEVISEFDILLIVAFFHYHVFSHPILKKTRTPPTAPQSKTSSSFVLLKCWSISCCSADCSIQRTLFLALSIWTTSKTRFMLLGDRSLDCISDRRHLGSGLASQSDTGRTSQLKNINATRTSGSYFTDAFPEAIDYFATVAVLRAAAAAFLHSGLRPQYQRPPILWCS